MLIDWFTVGAQALNFVILVWLMRRFLYRPVLRAIDAREKRIAAQLADAAGKEAEAQKERDEFERKNDEIDQRRAELMKRATDEAKAERDRLLDEAREAAEASSVKRQEALRNDARDLNRAITRRTQDEVFAVARRALSDLATTSLEERISEVFMRRLRGMDGPSKASLAAALATAAEPAVVRSAFELAADQRTAIQRALDETVPAAARVRFETAPDLVGGIELATKGHKVAWSIADYLSSMEKGVEELLQEKEKPEPRAVREESKAEPTVEAKAGPKAEETKPETTSA